jgi:hypothetical protein
MYDNVAMCLNFSCGIGQKVHCVMMHSTLHHAIMEHLWMKFIGLQVRRKLPWVTS